MDTVRQTFSIPEEKKQKFVALREEILSLEQVPLNMLQRFQGKCVSLTLMVPAAQLYTRAVAHARSRAQNSKEICAKKFLTGVSWIRGRAVPLGAPKNKRL